MTDRAVLFVDGNNWYHSLKRIGIEEQGRLDWVRIADKLVGARSWIGTRYYIGKYPQKASAKLYAEQRRFVAQLRAADSRISVHFGRLEPRRVRSAAAAELRRYLGGLETKIDRGVFQDLVAIAKRHRDSEVLVEKAVDVMLAVDMVVMAERAAYDTAYVLSADGDYTHAVRAVRATGRKVFAVSASPGAQLAGAVDAFIRPDAGWFEDVFLP